MTDIELIPPSDRARNYRHGHKTAGKYSPEYSIWLNMRARCGNSKNNRYSTYGARGIRVCERWDADFLNFLSDMGRRPGEDYSLDRIDNNGNYEPENCRWATRKEQCRNRTTSRFLTLGGETKTLAKWGAESGLGVSLLHGRLKRGWSIRKALTEPVRGASRKSTNSEARP